MDRFARVGQRPIPKRLFLRVIKNNVLILFYISCVGKTNRTGQLYCEIYWYKTAGSFDYRNIRDDFFVLLFMPIVVQYYGSILFLTSGYCVFYSNTHRGIILEALPERKVGDPLFCVRY